MSALSRTLYIPASVSDAYQEWKMFLSIPELAVSGKTACKVTKDIPDKEVRWLSRWGVARIDGRADFIPAQGGCILHLNLNGMGILSRLILTPSRHMERGLSKFANRFQDAETAAAAE